MTQSLRSFIEAQDREGRVVCVGDELHPVAEAGHVLARHEGKIVVLERVRGARASVVGGVLSSRELVAAALGVEVRAVVGAMAHAMDAPLPVTRIDSAPFLERKVERPRLDHLVPLLTFDPGAARPYTSSTIVAARSRRHGMNLSFHRMMYLGENRFAVRVVPRHLRHILEEGDGAAEVAVLIGVHPAVALAAATSGTPDFSELEMAAALLGGLDAVELDGLTVPAEVELVLRGRFTGELAEEGPFVDLTGTLDGVRREPVLEISAAYHRADFIYHTIVPGGREHRLLMGCPQEPRIHRAVANAAPGLDQVALTAGGCNWLHAVVSLENPRPGQARNAGLAALGAHPSLKRVVVVDSDIDVHDPAQVEWAIATRVRPDQDIVIIPACRGSSLDPSRRPEDDTTGKWIIDATVPPGRDRAEFVLAAPTRAPAAGKGPCA